MEKAEKTLIILTLIGGFILLLVFFLTFPEKKAVQKEALKVEEEKFLKAMKKREESECEKIENDYYRKTCFFNLTLEEAIKTKDVKLCEKVSQELINLCKDNYYFQIAVSEKDPSLCNFLTNATTAAICKEEATKK
jgi:hypothetical protein